MQFSLKLGITSEVKKTFLRDLGLLLHAPAFLVLPTLIIIFYFEEYYALPSFLAMAGLSIVVGQVLYQLFKNSSKSLRRPTLIMVALAWFIIPVFGSIPFYFIGSMDATLVGNATNLSDIPSAIFESMSGFTSTGLSMLDRPDTIPHSLQWWRSLSEWIGGIGIILLVLEFFSFSSKMNSLYQAEAMNWTLGDGKMEETVKKIWWIYLGLTITAIIAFYIAGMPGWEAINHGLTGVSTGGFSITKNSFTDYNHAIKWIAILFMTLGALSFQVHYLFFFKRKIAKISRLSEAKIFVVLLVGLVILVQLLNPGQNFVDNVFQSASALGTCGFNSVETAKMPISVLFLFVIAMCIGGNATSTTGGLKTRRIVWLAKGLLKSVKDSGKVKEEDKTSITINKKEIKDKEAKEQIKNAAYIFILWISALMVGSFLILLGEDQKFSFLNVLFDTASALSNVGLSTGVNGNDLSGFSKSVYIILMWLGRLEIFACIILIYTFLNLSIFHNQGE